MAVTIGRTNTNLIGSPASPSTIAAAGVSSGTLDLTATAGTIEAVLEAELQVGGSAPTTNPTVQFFYSTDGTNFVQDGGTITVVVATSTNYDLSYVPPPAAQKAKVTITNGATNSITAFAQASVLTIA